MDKNVLLKKVQDLNEKILAGKAMEAFEEYYDEKVSMQENEQTPTIGKSINREREKIFFSSITDFRGAKVLSVGASENKTFVEWFFDYTHKDWGVRKYHQISVQTWKDGKIIEEKFYYGG